MRLFFAGAEGLIYQKLLATAGVKSLLVSAFYAGYDSMLSEWQRSRNLLVDSGGYTARVKGVKIPIGQYIDFINRNRVKRAINLDTLDFNESLRNQRTLERNTDAYIIPVYHGNEYQDSKRRDWIKDLAAEYPLVCVGGTAESKDSNAFRTEIFRYVLKYTRDKVKVHGLGLHAMELLEGLPMYSVDSTNWIKPGRYGAFIQTKGRKVTAERGKSKGLFRTNRKAFAFDRLHYRQKGFWYARKILEYEVYLTELWAKRGVRWNDDTWKPEPHKQQLFWTR